MSLVALRFLFCRCYDKEGGGKGGGRVCRRLSGKTLWFDSLTPPPCPLTQAFCFTAHKFWEMGGFPNFVMMEVTRLLSQPNLSLSDSNVGLIYRGLARVDRRDGFVVVERRG